MCSLRQFVVKLSEPIPTSPRLRAELVAQKRTRLHTRYVYEGGPKHVRPVARYLLHKTGHHANQRLLARIWARGAAAVSCDCTPLDSGSNAVRHAIQFSWLGFLVVIGRTAESPARGRGRTRAVHARSSRSVRPHFPDPGRPARSHDGRPFEVRAHRSRHRRHLQITTSGLAYYRRHGNTPIFTDGWEHWALVGEGLVVWAGRNSDLLGLADAGGPGAGPDLPQVQAAVADAALQTGRDPSSIDVLLAEPVDWPDTSLGCAQPQSAYAQVVTPG